MEMLELGWVEVGVKIVGVGGLELVQRVEAKIVGVGGAEPVQQVEVDLAPQMAEVQIQCS